MAKRGLLEKAAEGLGKGLARVGEVGFANAVEERRQRAILALQNQYNVAERKADQKYRTEERIAGEKHQAKQNALQRDVQLREVREINVPLWETVEENGKKVTKARMTTDKDGNPVQAMRQVLVERHPDGKWRLAFDPAGQLKGGEEVPKKVAAAGTKVDAGGGKPGSVKGLPDLTPEQVPLFEAGRKLRDAAGGTSSVLRAGMSMPAPVAALAQRGVKAGYEKAVDYTSRNLMPVADPFIRGLIDDEVSESYQ